MRCAPLLTLVALGCSAASPLSSGSNLPRERTDECVQACTSLGLQMSAVVVIANSVGCVCEPGTKSGASSKAIGAAGGLLVLASQRQQPARTMTSR